MINNPDHLLIFVLAYPFMTGFISKIFCYFKLTKTFYRSVYTFSIILGYAIPASGIIPQKGGNNAEMLSKYEWYLPYLGIIVMIYLAYKIPNTLSQMRKIEDARKNSMI